jgi:PII interaction protein X
MNAENYLNHPTFGLLYRICVLDEHRDLFTTLYAQRIFFIVSNDPSGIKFEPLTRADARLLVENRLRLLRRQGIDREHQPLLASYKQIFQ